MSQVIVIDGTNIVPQTDGFIEVSTLAVSSLFDGFSSGSKKFVSTNLVGKFMFAGIAISGFFCFLFGQRSGAKIEREGGKLMLESTNAQKARLALTNRTIAA